MTDLTEASDAEIRPVVGGSLGPHGTTQDWSRGTRCRLALPIWRVATPGLPRDFTGAGDLTAATFLAKLLGSRGEADDVPRAAAETAAIVYGVLDVTVASGQAELQLVAAQAEIAAPSRTFEAVRLR